MNLNRCYPLLLVLFLGLVPFDSSADAAMAARISAQMLKAGRGEYDSLKDASRKPVETAEFFQLRGGLTVLDANTGAGYNAEILSAAVGPTGTVYAQNTHLVLRLIGGAHHEAMRQRLQSGRLPNVKYIIVDGPDMPFVDEIDVAFWGFNMHDFYNRDGDGEARTLEFLRSLKRGLKVGGILAIGEHVGVAGFDNAELHRLEPRIVYELLEKAGFVIEETSQLLANPADDHSLSVYADGLRYNTDRILVRARKAQ